MFSVHPVAFGLFSDEPRLISRIAETQVIPTGTGPLRHGVGLARRFVGVANPIFCFCERRFPRTGRLVIIERRWHDWQLVFIQCPMFSAFPNNRERFAPITLTREEPIAQFVIDRALALTPFL